MARSPLSKACILALALAAALRAGGQDSVDATEELLFESESALFDRQTNLIQLLGPQITQGDLRIVADEALATGIEFDEASEWRFTGQVRIEVGTAVIEADSAVFTFDNERLSRGELEGAPASFSDVDETRQTSISGRARKMSYDYVARTLRMTDNAWVQRDKLEMQGCDLIYDFTAERVSSGSADCSDLFRVRVLPDPDEQTSAPAPQ
jgi:lipopolysaccharide transport protein LptA